MSRKTAYVTIILKSGKCLNLAADDETIAKTKLGIAVNEYAKNPVGGILGGEQPAPLVFVVGSEIAAMYVSKEARGR